jgi:predicted dehydrogenase
MAREHTVGVIGLGFGRAHIRGFQTNGCRVVAVCGRDLDRTRGVATRYGVPHAFDRWEELIDQARPEIVSVAAPPYLHRPIVERAVSAGAHVICEKPLAMTTADASAIAAAVQRSGRVGMTMFNWRFSPALQRMHAMIAAGYLGRLWHAEARWLGPRWVDPAAAPTWRMDASQAGTGVLGDQGVHVADFVLWNFGRVARVVATSGIAYPSRTVPGGARPMDTEDHCQALLELESGATVQVIVSRVARGRNINSLEAHGAGGALAYLMDRDTDRWWLGELHAGTQPGALQRVDVDSSFYQPSGAGDGIDTVGETSGAALVAEMLRAIETPGQAPSPSLEDGLRAQAVVDAIVESIRRRSWIDVRA